MKTVSVLSVLLAAGAAANAQVFNFGSTGVLAGYGAFASQNFNVGAPGAITGFTISADMNAAGGFAYQSDMQLVLTGPNGVFVVGPNFGGVDWNDPGLGGTGTFPGDNGNPGSFQATYPYAFGDGMGQWTVRLENAYTSNAAGDTLDWNNVTITLVPTPGAGVLLGMGGLLAMRRRRA